MIRKLARPMLASVYIADGVDTLVKTDEHLDSAEGIIKHTRSVLPRKYARQIPDDPKVVAQALGGVKVGAGSLLALGKLPRLSATALALSSVPTIIGRYAFWETQEPEEKRARRSGFLTNVALLGGLGITALDKEGKPGLLWRVQSALPSKSETEKFAENAKGWISENTSKAQEFVADNKDDWIESAQDGATKVSSVIGDYAQRAQDFVSDNKDDWLAAAQDNAKTAKKGVVKAAAKAQEKAESVADVDSKKAKKLRKRADKALSKAQKKLKNFEF
ncbi:DoxX family protein [Corynebacterium sp. c6VSa_13]|uniref:DoxX family protein n=1 Tax=Corynebacterium sp. c6VSa_13 TaxID=2913496 RepID=UPI0022BA1239|nr:DoxX family protein [Corynebacterium sp. c6VSa_13]MCZ9309152.1 DoxX family protein [Corynebacterium sp. c6VSa_13]